MAVAEEQIAKVRNTIGDDKPFMVTMDRGYPSIPAFLRMKRDGVYFVARLCSSDFKAEQETLSSNDEDVNIRLTANRRYHYLGTEDEEIVMSQDGLSAWCGYG